MQVRRRAPGAGEDHTVGIGCGLRAVDDQARRLAQPIHALRSANRATCRAATFQSPTRSASDDVGVCTQVTALASETCGCTCRVASACSAVPRRRDKKKMAVYVTDRESRLMNDYFAGPITGQG